MCGCLNATSTGNTRHTMKKIKQFLDYAATHPDAVVTYHASDMVLAGHSNTLYLTEIMAIFHVKQYRDTYQQWSGVHNIANNQGSTVIGGQS